MELPIIGLVSGLLGGPILGAAMAAQSVVLWIVAFLVLAPLILIVLYSIFVWVANEIACYQWASGFKRRLRRGRLKRLVLDEPGRYILHVRYYGGGFDQVPVGPSSLAIAEDCTSQELMAIYPASRRAIDICERAGVQVKRV